MRAGAKEKEIKKYPDWKGKVQHFLFVDDIFCRENPQGNPKNLLELTSSMRWQDTRSIYKNQVESVYTNINQRKKNVIYKHIKRMPGIQLAKSSKFSWKLQNITETKLKGLNKQKIIQCSWIRKLLLWRQRILPKTDLQIQCYNSIWLLYRN